MKRDYAKKYIFREPHPFDWFSPVPVVVTETNDDGTHTGQLDFNRMNTVQKIEYS